MRRSPLVVIGTVAGLVGIIIFHTPPPTESLGESGESTATSPPSSTTATTSPSSTPTMAPTTTLMTTEVTSTTFSRATGDVTSTTARRATKPTSTTTRPVAPTSAPTTSEAPTTVATTTTSPTGVRSATGPLISYRFGQLSVEVTAIGFRITNVGIAALTTDNSFRSQSIDNTSIPILEQEVITAQSASIQGVSGASYTSSSFIQSLQGALKVLGL